MPATAHASARTQIEVIFKWTWGTDQRSSAGLASDTRALAKPVIAVETDLR